MPSGCWRLRIQRAYFTWISTTPLTWALLEKPGSTVLKPPCSRKETMQSAQLCTSARGTSAV
ncbi:MAG TPA: hypothetical protein PKV82_08500 [Anaerolineae bacterium]|nr:hypothetical protein [Anaerolineae bacterium]